MSDRARQAGRLLGLAIVILAPAAMAAEPLDPAIVEARRQKSNPSFSLLSFRHLDELFDTRAVTPGPTVWRLPASPLRLPDESAVTVQGKPTTLAAAMRDLRINALLVMRDGRIVREIHRNGGDETTRYIGYSMSKSWVSMMFGIALGQGRLGSLDQPVTERLPELRGTAYEGVTLRNLLTMRAGTSWVESYAPGSVLDKVRDDSTNTETAFYEDVATTLTRARPPGSTFNYSTLDTELAGKVLVQATGKTVSDYMTETLWRPAGMEYPGYWIMQGPRGRQHEWYGAGFAATLRDYGRLGQLMLDGGAADGRRVIPRAWVEESTRSATGDNTYFYFWWGIAGVDGFAANGVGSQHVYVDRATRTVVVIASYGGPPGSEDLFRSIVERLGQ